MLRVCAAHGKQMVIGTTGFTDDQKAQLLAVENDTALCMASNFSTGVNLCFKLLDVAAKVLGDDVDIEVLFLSLKTTPQELLLHLLQEVGLPQYLVLPKLFWRKNLKAVLFSLMGTKLQTM